MDIPTLAGYSLARLTGIQAQITSLQEIVNGTQQQAQKGIFAANNEWITVCTALVFNIRVCLCRSWLYTG